MTLSSFWMDVKDAWDVAWSNKKVSAGLLGLGFLLGAIIF